MGPLHFIDSGFNSAYYNMALDEHLLRSTSGCYLTVYGWSVPALSFGYGQDPEAELDLARVKRDGLHFVRRLTGGRAVLHDGDFTYSVAGDVGGVFGASLSSTFRAIGLALKRSLEILGVPCDLERGTVRDERRKDAASLPCFASTSRHEIKVQGKKLVGSAQRREKSRFLQHGSFRIGERLEVTDYLRLSAADKAAYRKTLARESATLLAVTGRAFSYEAMSAAFRKGFGESLGMGVGDYALGGDDCTPVRALERKYFSDDWNLLCRSPEPSPDRPGTGGTCQG